MKVSNSFILEEYIPEDVYKERGTSSYSLIDNRIYDLMQRIRNHFGCAIKINDWSYGGNFNYRGYRPLDCEVGSKYSQHKFGRAVDFSSKLDAKEMVKEIIENRDSLFKEITFIEVDITWVHIDIRSSIDNELKLWSPDRGFVSIADL